MEEYQVNDFGQFSISDIVRHARHEFRVSDECSCQLVDTNGCSIINVEDLIHSLRVKNYKVSGYALKLDVEKPGDDDDDQDLDPSSHSNTNGGSSSVPMCQVDLNVLPGCHSQAIAEQMDFISVCVGTTMAAISVCLWNKKL